MATGGCRLVGHNLLVSQLPAHLIHLLCKLFAHKFKPFFLLTVRLLLLVTKLFFILAVGFFFYFFLFFPSFDSHARSIQAQQRLRITINYSFHYLKKKKKNNVWFANPIVSFLYYYWLLKWFLNVAKETAFRREILHLQNPLNP